MLLPKHAHAPPLTRQLLAALELHDLTSFSDAVELPHLMIASMGNCDLSSLLKSNLFCGYVYTLGAHWIYSPLQSLIHITMLVLMIDVKGCVESCW